MDPSISSGVQNVMTTPTTATFQLTTTQAQQLNVNVVTQGHAPNSQHTTTTTFSLSADSYEEVFKEITKKLYGDDQGFAELIDASGNIQQANIIYDTDAFRTDLGGQGVTFLSAPNGTLPPGTIVLQRKICQDKDGRLWSMEGVGEQLTLVPEQQSVHTPAAPAIAASTSASNPTIEERWFESEDVLSWTPSKIARYNPSQKVFRCVDCDFVGFLSRVAEHWLGNHASPLRVFQCPRCPYTSAWARCVRMHLTRQHGETVNDNSMWKENPVLEEVTKYLSSLKGGVEARVVEGEGGERREEKPFVCYVCEKQFNRADHVKKHFTRMHREHPYDINKIKKHTLNKHAQQGVIQYSKLAKQQRELQQQRDAAAVVEADLMQHHQIDVSTAGQQQQQQTISLQLDASGQTVTIPHIAYFNPPSTPGQSGPLQGIAGVGGTKKESKSKQGKMKKKVGEKMYTCSYCPWQGVDNWCLKRHLNTHIKPFLCALCDYKAARSERLATHVLKVHNKRVCHKCSFLADDTDALSQHIQDAHQNPLVKTGFNCNVCQEYFELRADLEAHAILEHQKVIVQCDLCDFRTTDELSMEAHLREKHNLQPGMGAVAAAAAAAQSLANNSSSSTFQMQLPTRHHMQLSEPLTLDQQQSLLLNSGDPLSQSSIAATVAAVSDAMPPITFQQDANGTIIPKIEPGLQSIEGVGECHENLLSGELVQGEEEEEEEESEPETLCENCGIEFGDEASLKLHEKLHWTEGPNDRENPAKKKNIVRSYVCSTCSYTASTKRLIMQHQRAHNGLELVCKADGCMFSTPFDNTLKEHIHLEHAAEPNVRCPHCGLKVPSTNSFTYHWRSHHKNLCSLCVNLYRIKYGIKENDLHQLIAKSMLELLNEDAQVKSKPVIHIDENDKIQQQQQNRPTDQFVNEMSQPSPSCTPLDHNPIILHNLGDDTIKLENSSSGISINTEGDDASSLDDCLNNNNNNNNTTLLLSPSQNSLEPPRKKPKLDLLLDFSSILSALERQKARLSLKVIPDLNEVLVTPVISSHQLHNPRCSPAQHKLRFCLQINNTPRRVLNRNSPSWLLRSGRRELKFKCHHIACVEGPSPRSFKRMRDLILHRLWHHSKPTHQCDCCPSKFPHLYQALLHKMREHTDQHVQDQVQSLLMVQPHEIRDFSPAEDLLFHNNQPIRTESQPLLYNHHHQQQSKQPMILYKSELV